MATEDCLFKNLTNPSEIAINIYICKPNNCQPQTL